MIFLTPGEPSGAMFMPAQQNVAKKLRKSNKTWRFGSNTKIAKVNYARTIAVSANTQNYISFSITVPDGYEILSANISAQHNTILIGQAIVSGNALYFPYISTTSYSSEIFTLDVFFIKL